MANKEVDTRIVEMQFDAKNFDKGIRRSTKNLEDFKKQLQFEDAVKQMDTVIGQSAPMNKAIADMAKNVGKMAKELTGIGSISTYVAKKIQDAWHGAANSVERFVKSMTSDQIRAGADKYDRLLKSVQTIMNATGESEQSVYSVMEKLNHYTDETSYNFADMSENIGKFTTAGIKLRDAEEAMEGIANWAALSGQNATAASRAMYNISQAMSANAMQKLDWKSIQNAGMDTRQFRDEAVKAAVAVGTLVKKGDKFFTKKGNKEVNLDNFAETLQFKWFDKATMMNVFKVFADSSQGIGEAAYKAAQRCTTFNDALGAWKDMLSTGWMQSYEHVFGKLSDAMNLFSGICNKVSESLSAFVSLRNGILKQWNLSGGRNSLWGALVGELETPDGKTLFKDAYGLLDAMQEIGHAIYDAFWDFVRNFVSDENLLVFDADRESSGMAFLGASLAQLGKKVREFTGTIQDFFFAIPEGETENRFDRIRRFGQAVFAAITLVVNAINNVGHFVGELLGQLSPAFKAIELLFDYLVQLFLGDAIGVIKNNTLGNFFHGLAETLRPVTTVINYVVVSLAKLIAAFVTFAKQSGLINGIKAAFQILLSYVMNLVMKLVESGLLQKIISWIQNLMGKLPGLISRIYEIGKAISSFIKNSKGLNKIRSLFSAHGGLSGIFSGGWKNILKNLSSFGSDLWSGLVEGLTEGWLTFGDKLLAPFLNFWEKVKAFFGIHSPSTEAAEVGVNIMSGLLEGLKNGEGGIIGQVKSLFTRIWNAITDSVASAKDKIKGLLANVLPNLKTFLGDTNFKDILGFGKEFMKWTALFKIGSGVGQFGKGLKSIGKGVKVFGKNLKHLNLKNIFSNMFNISNIINSNNKDISGTWNFGNLGPQLLEIAGAIGILTLAAKEIIAMKPEDLKKAGIAVGAMLAGLVTASVITSKFGGNGLGLLGAAAAIWALSKAMNAILAPLEALMAMPLMGENGEIGGLAKGLGAVFALLLSFSVATGLAGGGGKLLGTAATIFALALALKAVIAPMKILMEIPLMGENGEIGGLAKGIGAVFAILLAFGVAAGLAGSGGGKMLSAAATLLTLVLALKAVIEPIKILMDLPMMGKNGEFGGLAQGLTAMLGILLSLSVAAALAGSGASIKGMLNIAALVGAVLLLMGPIQTMAEMSWDKLLPAVANMLAILWSLAGVTKIVGGVKPASIMAVAIMVGAVWALAKIGIDIATQLDPTQVLAGFGAIVSILGFLSLAVFSAGRLKPEQLNGLRNIFIAFTVLIGVIAGSLVALKLLDVGLDTTIVFFAGLLAVLGLMGNLVKQASRLNEKGIGRVALVLGIMGILIGATAGSLVAMAKFNVDWKLVAAFTAGMTALIAALGWALPILGKLTPGEAVTSILVLAAAVVAIMGAIALMIPVVMGSIGSAMEKLAARLKTMSGLLKDFFSRMTEIDEGSMSHALAVFDNLKDLILKFAGFSMYDTDISSVLTQLNRLGTGLDLFFVGSDRLPDPDSAVQFKILDKFVEIGPSLSGFSVGNLPEEVLYLGVALGLFQEATKDITTAEPIALDLLQSIFGQADNIEKFAKLPLDTFTSQMTGLGGAMSLYAKGAKEVTGMDEGEDIDISKSVGILKAVSDAIAGTEDGKPFEIPSNMPDQKAMGIFAGQLESLGTALSKFATAAKSMETDTTNAMALLKFLADIGGYVNNDNLAVVNAFDQVGHVDESGKGGKLGQFSLDIGALATALSDFATNVGGKKEQFETGLNALDRFHELKTKLSPTNLGFVTAFDEAGNGGVHKDELEKFSEDIGALGRALASFVENVTLDNGQQADFNYALHALNFMATLSTRLANIKIGISLHTLIHGQDYTLGDMSDDMQLLANALSDFGTSVTSAGESGKSFDGGAVNDALNAVARMIEICNTLNLMKADGSGLLTWGDYMYDLANMMYAFSNANIGKEYGSSGTLADQIAQFASSISTAFTKAGDINIESIEAFKNIAEGIRALQTLDPTMNFEYPGEMIAAGIASGIRKGESEVVQAIVDVVQSAIDAGNKVAIIKSPSHVFAEMGEFMDLGLVEGLTGSQGKVEDASGDMISSTIEQAGLIMGAISAALADAVDLQPKITPVLDLSNLVNGAASINGILDGYGLNLNGALDRAVAATGATGPAEVIIQNPTDLTGIQSAISTLQTEIGNLQTAISNMKIVLNTGVVAGGVTDDIDLNLGRRSLYASRRN